MQNAILQAPVSNLKSLDNLFIEMTSKNCNQRCKHCYIDFPLTKKVKDFIQVDVIKKALEDTKAAPLQCIYLTGAEPMTHPDFNGILRLCLKYANVCICTNGSFINEKKARFLKRVQDEGCFEIIFKLSLEHYEEEKNDDIRGRGSYRQVIHAVKHLIKYDFNPILQITNCYNENPAVLNREIKIVLNNAGYDAQDRNICINYCHKSGDNRDNDINKYDEHCRLDCEYGRIITQKGVYSCPFLANDHRGRCGSDFLDYSRKTNLETSYCNTCLKNIRQVFGIDFKNFC